MLIPFAKMHGAANDYIFVDCTAELPVAEAELPALARQMSDRRRGIGSDGLILILPAPVPDTAFGFRMFNRDGSEGEMCGNGMRCFARYVVSRGLTDLTDFVVATKSGPIRCWVVPGEQTDEWAVTCDLGTPRLSRDEVPTALPPGADGRVVEQRLELGGRVFAVTALSTGVPHAVLFVGDLEGLPWRQLGRELETHAAFPRRTNVEFARVVRRDWAEVKVWERGSGETMACGTGACAVVVAGVLTGRLDRKARISLPGGDLEVVWRDSDGHVLLSGPAAEVFQGIFIRA